MLILWAEIKPSEALYLIIEGKGRSVRCGVIIPFGGAKPSPNCVYTLCHVDTINEVTEKIKTSNPLSNVHLRVCVPYTTHSSVRQSSPIFTTGVAFVAEGHECHSRCKNGRRLANGRMRGVRYAYPKKNIGQWIRGFAFFCHFINGINVTQGIDAVG